MILGIVTKALTGPKQSSVLLEVIGRWVHEKADSRSGRLKMTLPAYSVTYRTHVLIGSHALAGT